MKVLMAIATLSLVLAPLTPQSEEASAGFDNKSNGMVDDLTHQADQAKFEEIVGVADGLGPLYNAQSCRECHQNPTSGGGSQITELRVGHLGPDGRFNNPDIPIARGTEIIRGRTLVNDRAICPNAAFPDTEIQERMPGNRLPSCPPPLQACHSPAAQPAPPASRAPGRNRPTLWLTVRRNGGDHLWRRNPPM